MPGKPACPKNISNQSINPIVVTSLTFHSHLRAVQPCPQDVECTPKGPEGSGNEKGAISPFKFTHNLG